MTKKKASQDFYVLAGFFSLELPGIEPSKEISLSCVYTAYECGKRPEIMRKDLQDVADVDGINASESVTFSMRNRGNRSHRVPQRARATTAQTKVAGEPRRPSHVSAVVSLWGAQAHRESLIDDDTLITCTIAVHSPSHRVLPIRASRAQ